MSAWRDAYYQYMDIDDPVELDFFRRSLEFSRNEPLDDVYELALLVHSIYGSREEWYYRGQRIDRWSIEPSLFRADVPDINHEFQKLSSLVRYLQSELHVSQDDALAIAKHYSEIPQHTTIKSWMLDVTMDPLIACFFASLNGKSGDIGKVFLFKSYEMERYGSQTPKRLGNIRVISPQNVPRIEKQQAAFIDGAHPVLLEGYLPLNWTFYQKENIVFRDPARSITEEDLLPGDDEYKEIVLSWENEIWPEEVPPSKIVSPTHTPLGEVTPKDYLAMIQEWLEQTEYSYEGSSDTEKRVIRDLCKVHSKLRNSDDISLTLKTEITLQQTVKAVIAYASSEDREISFDDVVSRLWHESSDQDTERQTVKRIIRDVRPSFEFSRQWR